MIVPHIALVALLVGTQVLFTVLAVLNVRHSERTIDERSAWLRETLGLSDPGRNADYLRARTGVSQLSSWATLGAILLVLYSGLYREAVAFVEGLGLGTVGEGIVLFLGVVVGIQLLSAPFSLFRTFVVEEIFEFNEQTPRVWLRDQVIGLCFAALLTAVVGGGLLLSVQALGRWWPVAGVALLAVVSLVMQVLFPRVIMPLIYDFKPIEDGELRASVESVFTDADFSPDGVYEVEFSSHTSKANAFFAGFGPSKRVGVADTLIEGHELPEVESVLAHELGHYRLRHVWKLLGGSLLVNGVLLVGLAVLIDQPWLTSMFGLGGADAPLYGSLLTGGLWLWPLLRLASPLTNQLSIRFEYQADAFAVETTGDPEAEVTALRKLADDNLSNPFPHPWYETVHYDHPPIPKRVQAIQERFVDSDVDDEGGSSETGTQGASSTP